MIDASDDWFDDWVVFLRGSELTLRYCFLTHCHIDNIINLSPLIQMLPQTSVCWSMSDKGWVDMFPRACERYHRFEMKGAPLPMNQVRPQDILLSSATDRSTTFLKLGNTLCFYIATPGHSLGHTMLHIPQEKLLFSGDLLFNNAVGRVDLPWANGEQLAQSLRMLEDFPDNTVVLPGHGKMTTMGKERKENRALQRVYEMMLVGRQVPSVGHNTGYL